MTSGSLLPMMCLISSRAQVAVLSAPVEEIDTQFSVLFSTFAILIVFSRYASSAFCVVTATARSCVAVFPNTFLLTCYSVVIGCSSPTSRGSLFFVILLLLSGAVELGCPPCSHLHRLCSTRHRHQHDPRCLLESRPVQVLPSLTSFVAPMFGSVLGCWVVHLMLMILHERWGVWCRLLLCVHRNFPLELRFGMTDDTGPFQYASRSRILGRVPFNCIKPARD